MVEKAKITIIEAVMLFVYEKANKKYLDKPKLHQQVVNKALPIAKTLYLSYFLLFLFDNARNHSVYT